MALFKQQAYYIGNKNVFFIDRAACFKTKEDAEKNLESFSVRTKNRIPNKQYVCIVTEVENEVEAKRTIIDKLADKLL